MKLADWAREQGIDYKTAYRWFRSGILPLPSTQLPTGTILVHPHKAQGAAAGVALYVRVSSADQKQDLTRQLARLVEWATQQRLAVVKSVAEIGSGLNGRRAKLTGLLRDPSINAIVVEHRDRLARFGSEYIEAALASSGRRVLIAESKEMNDDLVQDMVDVLTSFCARLYGKRSARNRALRAVEAARATGSAPKGSPGSSRMRACP